MSNIADHAHLLHSIGNTLFFQHPETNQVFSVTTVLFGYDLSIVRDGIWEPQGCFTIGQIIHQINNLN